MNEYEKNKIKSTIRSIEQIRDRTKESCPYWVGEGAVKAYNGTLKILNDMYIDLLEAERKK